MSSFLEICQLARQECGMGGSGPTNTTSQTGALLTLVNRTSQAWVDIQKSKPYWKFLRAQLTDFPLIVGTNSYTVSTATPAGFGLTTVDKWDKQACWLYTTTEADRSKLTWLPYQDFRKNFAADYASGKPAFWTEGLSGTVLFDKEPDDAYLISMDYWMTPEQLVNSTDIPALPEQYHDLIAWKAVMMFAGSESAVELYQWAAKQYGPMYLQLCIDQMDAPEQVRAYALAGGRRPTTTFRDAR